MDGYRAYVVFIITLFLTVLLLFPAFVQSRETKETINIGLLFDGEENRNISFISSFRSELNALLGSKYDIQINDAHVLDGQWSFSTIENNYYKLVSDKKIHIIVGAGAITSSIISSKKEYTKPVIAVGIVDPIVQGVSQVTGNKSGIHNLTYIIGNKSIIKDLDTFHKVYPYKKLGFVYYEEFSKTMTQKGRAKINLLMARKKSHFIRIPVKNSVNEVFESLNKVDAVYISYLGKFEGKDKQYLIDQLNKRKIPSFGSSIANTRSGMLAAMAPDEIVLKIIRRISLNIEAILEGQNPGELKVFADFGKNLTINMKTAAQIGFSPKFTILSQAELINEYYYDAKRTVNLVDVMKEAAQKSLDIEVSQTYVENAQYDISKAKTDYYPDLSAGLNSVMIDEKRAELSNGTQAEYTTTGNLTARQLIYSDQVMGNITSQKYLYQASLLDHKNIELDVIFKAVQAYFRILKAKTSRKIIKDNINLIKKNLKTAEQREIIGYSGRSDVLRWKSQLATTTSDFLVAQQEVILAKNDLNRILNRSQDEPFYIEDTSMDDTVFSIYSANSIEKYIDNQKSLDLFTRFFIGQCINNSYEIKGLNEKKLSYERFVLSLKRKYYLPTISLSATQDHLFTRNGSGADVSGSNPVDSLWSAGIYLNLPFYEGGSKSIDIKKTNVEISRIQKQKLILAHDIENSARTALSDAMVKMINLELSKQASAYAKQSLELVQDSYAKGTVSVVELADAQNNALTGELSAISSVYDYLISLFTMEKVYGEFSLLMPADSEKRITNKFEEYYDKSIN